MLAHGGAGAGAIRHTIVGVLDRRLTYFLAVAREGSFGCRVAQVEAALGVRLLERGWT